MTMATREALVQQMVQQVEPVLRETAATSEAQRRLAPEAMNALIDAGVLLAFLPTKYNGAELGAVHGIKLFEELATIDSAAAWVGLISALGAWLTLLLPPEAADEILADPRAIINGSIAMPLAATPVQGGYRVSGRVTFGSGCNYATWLQGQAFVMENGAPKIGPTGMPVAILAMFPAGEAKIIDNWDTLGMRGTGSSDFVVEDILVPEHHLWPMGPYAPVNPNFTDPMSRMGLWVFSPAVASVALGVARAAISDLVKLAQSKTPTYTQIGLADKPMIQDKLARARATVDAARSYLYGSVSEAEEVLRTAPKLNIEQGMPLALSASFAAKAAVEAVDLVHSCIGTSGIRNAERFPQYFRDVHTISQHAFASSSRFESVGKLMLGRESDWPFYYL